MIGAFRSSRQKMSDVYHLSGPLSKRKFSSTGSKDHCLWFVIGGFRSVFWVSGRDPFNQNSNRSDREKWSTSKGRPVFSKIFRLDRTDALSLDRNFRKFWLNGSRPLCFKVRCLWSYCDQNPSLIFQIFLIDFIPRLQTSTFRWGKNTEDSD